MPTTLACALYACVGCDVFDAELERRVRDQPSESCRTHADCHQDGDEAAACVEPERRCVRLHSEDCALTTGDLTSPSALLLGSLFSQTHHQQSARLAVEELNAVGGVPSSGSHPRPLALVSCQELPNPRRAAAHLAHTLKVPAIIGPTTSQSTIELTNEITAPAGTLLISPTALASSVANLTDSGLTWTMALSDEQGAPLLKAQLNALEEQLRHERGERPIKLAVLHRNDALGTGVRASLSSLVLNGASLADNQAAGSALIEAYTPFEPEQPALVDRQREFAPDLIVLAGLGEAISALILPLEQSWGEAPRPYYVLSESVKVGELLRAAAEDDGLRVRVRGLGTVPTPRSEPVYEAFRVSYQARFPGRLSTLSGMGATHDATYAIAFALAATRALRVSGAGIAEGLRMLSGGATEVELQSTKILAAFEQLTAGEPIAAIGSYAPLAWDERGAPLGGRLEIWCVAAGPPPSYRGSGLTFDVETQAFAGAFRGCEP